MPARSRSFGAVVLIAGALCAPAVAEGHAAVLHHARHRARPVHARHHVRLLHARRHHARLHHGRASATTAGGCAAADLTAAQTSVAALRDAVVCLVNEQRMARGLPAVREDGRLDRSAQGWSHQMVSTGTFAHVGSGTDPGSRIRAAGYGWRAYGENIATGFPTPRSVLRGWMASTGHCRNILDPTFADLGVGVVDRPVAPAASGPATWTQDFGLPAGARAPSHDTGPQSGCPYRV